MAKRKRLTPARTDFLSETETNSAQTESKAPEAKSMFPMGIAQSSPRPAPIAQVAGDAATRAAFDEMTDMISTARAEGRIVERLSLSDIDLGHLVRDRIQARSEELDALKSSLKARGQQVPVEVLDRGPEASPRYGLISGWRRMLALSEIGAADVLAIVREPKSASDAYVAMVEENEIRADISFYERARIVVKALEQGVYSDPKAALQSLFANVSRAKRSKIKSFMTLVEMLDGALSYPAAISERNGLELVKRLSEDPSRATAIKARLAQETPRSADAELALLLTETSRGVSAGGGEAGQASSRERSSGTSPRANTPSPSLPDVHLAYDETEGQITLSGAGVDEAFAQALAQWLARR